MRVKLLSKLVTLFLPLALLHSVFSHGEPVIFRALCVGLWTFFNIQHKQAHREMSLLVTSSTHMESRSSPPHCYTHASFPPCSMRGNEALSHAARYMPTCMCMCARSLAVFQEIEPSLLGLLSVAPACKILSFLTMCPLCMVQCCVICKIGIVMITL